MVLEPRIYGELLAKKVRETIAMYFWSTLVGAVGNMEWGIE